jgi:hypothetical protein
VGASLGLSWCARRIWRKISLCYRSKLCMTNCLPREREDHFQGVHPARPATQFLRVTDPSCWETGVRWRHTFSRVRYSGSLGGKLLYPDTATSLIPDIMPWQRGVSQSSRGSLRARFSGPFQWRSIARKAFQAFIDREPRALLRHTQVFLFNKQCSPHRLCNCFGKPGTFGTQMVRASSGVRALSRKGLHNTLSHFASSST